MKVVAGWVDEAVEDDRFVEKSWDRGGHKLKYITLHKTAGFRKKEECADYFAQDGVQSSANFIIDPDGTFLQGIPTSLGPWANAPLGAKHADFLTEINPNLECIAIEHIDPAEDNSTPLTDAAKDTSFRLIKCLCDAHGIPARRGDAAGGVIDHRDIDQVNRARCPGNYPHDELWAYLKGGDTVAALTLKDVQDFFVDGGKGAWKSKTTDKVLQGQILKFYSLNNGLALFGLPVTDEQHDIPGIIYSICERAVIVYDPKRVADHPPIDDKSACYTAHIDGGAFLNRLWQRTPGDVVVVEKLPQAVRDDIVALNSLVIKLKNDAHIA
jgi:N-acetylmuramoyl-L-alanine amidase